MTEPRPPIYTHLSTLSDPVRVRMLRLLEREELGVGELASVVQLPQSTVSRHLKALHTDGWVQRRAEGAAALLSFDVAAITDDARALWELVGRAGADEETMRHDLARVAAVLAGRRVDSRAWFGRVAGRWGEVRRGLYGASFLAPTLAGMLPRDWVVVDLGCGPGDTAALLAPAVARVVAVDQEQAMLDAAAARLEGHSNVELVRAELTALPLADASVDAALCLFVLHHVAEPAEALAEAGRVLRPGRAVTVLDMQGHDLAAYRQSMGHAHLGFSAEDLRAHGAAAGLTLEAYCPLAPDPEAQGPPLFVATLRG